MQTTPRDMRPIPIREAFRSCLGISPPTGYRLIADGVLRTLKIGRRRYTTQKFIDAAVEKLAGKADGRS